jgi:glucosyl-dolichyl phosphate glucuronosyltransferase
MSWVCADSDLKPGGSLLPRHNGVEPNGLSISVVICAYTEDRWGSLLQAIDSVRWQTYPPHEIIVVVDHNASLRQRLRAEVHDVHVIDNTGIRGLSSSRNSGVTVARGNVVAFLDDDAVAELRWLACLITGYQDPSVLGVGGPVEPIWHGKRPTWFPVEFDWVVGCTFLGMPKTTCSVRALIGCNMSVRREIFQEIGLFRIGMGRVGKRPLAGEETEFCIRATQHWNDRHWLYEPDARVRHAVPHTRATWIYFCSRCYAEGISKALISRLVGPRDGLRAERTYTFHTLPRGIVRGILAAWQRGELTGIARATVIIVGIAITITGYINGRFIMRFTPRANKTDGAVRVLSL